MIESSDWFVDKHGIPHPGWEDAKALVAQENPGQQGIKIWDTEDWDTAQDFAWYVKALNLMGYGLQSLPEDIACFENLEYLLVRQFEPYSDGTPPEVSGPDYPESGDFLKALAGLSKLHTLRLEFPGLRDLTACIGELTSLKRLRIEGFEGSTLPPEIVQLTKLEVLIIRGGHRGLKKCPPNLGLLNHIEHLDLSYNQLSELPADFANMQSLRSLVLSKNQFSRIPASIFKLSELEVLDLSYNLIKQVPDEICQLTKLKTLKLYGNELKKIGIDARLFLESRHLLPQELGY